MRSILLFLFMIWGGFCLAQTNENSLKKLGNSVRKTWAVVIGISDYQDKDIPDLRFAHRDAEAFALWLQSPAGGGLEGDQLQVLINEKATAGRVAEALDALLEHVQENDKVFIYFSGHGDVERKTLSQPGFLLCWDAPSRVYMGGGTYSLAYLQEVVATLSLQNKAKVTVIADACRAGKLAGSQIGGPQLTSANMQRQQANEMKILSCQSTEYSLEGTQWGGGRGVFSYHLVDGLYGLADRNADGVVTLGELDRYLEDHVTSQAAPISQVPVLLGNKTDGIAIIHEETLADLTRIKSGEMTYLATTDSRGLEEEVLAKLDSGIVEKYMAFKEAVMEKRFFPDPLKVNDKPSADELYTLLITEPGLSSLYGAMTRNYAAALQDDAQQTLNKTMAIGKDNSFEAFNYIRLPSKVVMEKINTYPRCLNRAAELLGSKHYMYPALKARKYFFEGFLIAYSNRNQNQELGERVLALFRLSLAWQAEQPQVYWQIGQVYGWNLLQPDSLEHYTRLAMEVYPNWTRPCTDAAFILSYNYKLFDRAKLFLDHASHIDSNSIEVLRNWAMFNHAQNNHDEAERQLKMIIGMDSTYANPWNNLGLLYINTRRYTEAELVLKKAIELDSTYTSAFNNLGSLYNQTRRYSEAELVLKQAITLDSSHISSWNNLGVSYYHTHRYSEAEPVMKKTIALDSNYVHSYINLGQLYSQTRRFAEAETFLKKAVELDSTICSSWNNLSIVFIGTRRYTEAESVLKKVIALDSNYIHSYINLVRVYLNTRRFTEAEPVIKKVIALDSTSVRAWINLGTLYTNTRRYEEAEPTIKKVLALDSTYVIAWNELGHLYIQTRRYTEAEAALKRAIALDSTYAPSLANLGFIYNQTHRYTEAEQFMKKAIHLDSLVASRWANLGNLFLNTSRYSEAEQVLKRAIALDSTNANPRKHLGMAYFKTNRPEDARQNFLKAIELNPNYAAAYHGMAYLLASEGKTEKAVDYVEQAIGKGSTLAQLEEDEDLALLRALPEWEGIMMLHFSKVIYYNLACEQSLKGEVDKAFESLELSLTNGWKDYDWMQQDTDLALLREQKERWSALMKKHFPDQYDK